MNESPAPDRVDDRPAPREGHGGAVARGERLGALAAERDHQHVGSRRARARPPRRRRERRPGRAGRGPRRSSSRCARVRAQARKRSHSSCGSPKNAGRTLGSKDTKWPACLASWTRSATASRPGARAVPIDPTCRARGAVRQGAGGQVPGEVELVRRRARGVEVRGRGRRPRAGDDAAVDETHAAGAQVLPDARAVRVVADPGQERRLDAQPGQTHRDVHRGSAGRLRAPAPSRGTTMSTSASPTTRYVMRSPSRTGRLLRQWWSSVTAR